MMHNQPKYIYQVNSCVLFCDTTWSFYDNSSKNIGDKMKTNSETESILGPKTNLISLSDFLSFFFKADSANLMSKIKLFF
jgi:hypothetical protein